MNFYSLTKEERDNLVSTINREIRIDLNTNKTIHLKKYFSNVDTYIRKAAYLAIGKIYKSDRTTLNRLVEVLEELMNEEHELIRQTVINAAGEIGIFSFSEIEKILIKGLFDSHHKVKNAVIGSLKKIGEKNPEPVLEFAEKYLDHPDAEIRRQICHGIELYGRDHPNEVLPVLKKLQHDQSARVRNMVIHVVGQISYKKGCLETVVPEILTWENKPLVNKCLLEIIDVHKRYEKFSAKSADEAESYIKKLSKTYT